MTDLRRLTEADYDAVLDLWRRAGLTSLRPSGRDSRPAFTRQLQQGQIVLGLEQAGRLIGCVVLTHDTRKGWINRLTVDPDYRRRGHARRLIRAAEETFRAQGVTVMAALIEEWNTSSLVLFEAEGFASHRDIVYVSKRDSASA